MAEKFAVLRQWMKSIQVLRGPLLATLVLFLFGQVSLADTLHAIGAEAYQHHGSSWIFPQQIDGFVRVGAPQDIDGTIDVVAYYARVENGVRTTAIVDVYPPDSAAAEASLVSAKAALELKIKSAKLTPVQSESVFKVGSGRELAGVKVSYTAGDAADPQAILYFFDTGAWIVKIRVMSEKNEKVGLQAADNFVREQRWNSLELTDETCTGPACRK